VRHLCRIALLSIIALFSIQPASLFVPRASAAALPSAAPQNKRKNKNKRKNRKQKILKGRRGKRSRKPA
jgi:hypothetical protein